MRVAAALCACLMCGAAYAEDKPALLPTRDVAVTYRTTLDGQVYEQHFRWCAANRTARVLPPGGGVEMLMDYRTHHLSVMHPSDRTVLEIDDGVPAPPGAGRPYTRAGAATVAGLSCTEWTATDPAGHPAQLCVTQDGVLLRVRADDIVMFEAQSVDFAPQDPAAFRVPADYTRVKR
jgi:hypothetical protein